MKFIPHIIFLLISSAVLWGQPTEKDLKALILKNLEDIHDYEVMINIQINMPGLRMPEKEVKYYFKEPNKSKLDSKGFAVVPKDGIMPFTNVLKSDSLSITYLAETDFFGHQVYIVTLADSLLHEGMQARLWIDRETGIVHQGIMQVDGTDLITVKFEYELVDDTAYLPVSTEVRLKLPSGFRGLKMLGKNPVDAKKLRDSMKDNDEFVTGLINLEFYNYKLNRSIPDDFFEDEAETKVKQRAE